MFALDQTRALKVTAASVLAAAMIALNVPLTADAPAVSVRPVGPHEPILASVGERRVVASFAPEFGSCKVNASVWDSIGAQADSSLRIQVSLVPGQRLYIDSLEAETKSLNFECGDDAKTLPIAEAS